MIWIAYTLNRMIWQIDFIQTITKNPDLKPTEMFSFETAPQLIKSKSNRLQLMSFC